MDPAPDRSTSAAKRLAKQVAAGEIELFGESMGLPVELSAPDPAWPARFGQLKMMIQRQLGPSAIRVDHVGSTSIPGLAAKPVIDIQVSVLDVNDEGSFRPALESLGWPMRAREPGHRFFRPAKGKPRTVHVHVCQTGSEWERVHLLFRDYLRAHPHRAAAYAAVKSELAERHQDDGLEYTDAKGPFIEEQLRCAEEWAAQTGWSAG